MCDFSKRHNFIQQVVRKISPGRIGWIKKLEDITEAFEPHKSVGRVIIYHELLVELKKDLRKYDWRTEWRQVCEDRLDQFFDQYVTERAIHDAKNRYCITLLRQTMNTLLTIVATNTIMHYLKNFLF
jgi:exonuclease V gamma subunit